MFNIIDIIEKNEFINWLQVFVIKYFYIKSLILIYVSDLELFLINFINIICKH